MKNGRPWHEAYQGCREHEYMIGWRREHARRVWAAVQATLAVPAVFVAGFVRKESDPDVPGFENAVVPDFDWTHGQE